MFCHCRGCCPVTKHGHPWGALSSPRFGALLGAPASTGHVLDALWSFLGAPQRGMVEAGGTREDFNSPPGRDGKERAEQEGRERCAGRDSAGWSWRMVLGMLRAGMDVEGQCPVWLSPGPIPV